MQDITACSCSFIFFCLHAWTKMQVARVKVLVSPDVAMPLPSIHPLTSTMLLPKYYPPPDKYYATAQYPPPARPDTAI